MSDIQSFREATPLDFYSSFEYRRFPERLVADTAYTLALSFQGQQSEAEYVFINVKTISAAEFCETTGLWTVKLALLDLDMNPEGETEVLEFETEGMIYLGKGLSDIEPELEEGYLMDYDGRQLDFSL